MDHQETYDEKLIAVVKAVKDEGDQESNLIPLSSGVVLERIPVPRAMLMDIWRKYKEPEIPTFFNEDKQRNEENPNDPDYIKALEDFNVQVTFAMLDIGIVFGTKIHSLPKDFVNPYSPEWVDTCNVLGLEVPENDKIKYLKWVKYIAAPTEGDLVAISNGVLPNYGVRQTTVEQAIETFPGKEGGSTNPEV